MPRFFLSLFLDLGLQRLRSWFFRKRRDDVPNLQVRDRDAVHNLIHAQPWNQNTYE